MHTYESIFYYTYLKVALLRKGEGWVGYYMKPFVYEQRRFHSLKEKTRRGEASSGGTTADPPSEQTALKCFKHCRIKVLLSFKVK